MHLTEAPFEISEVALKQIKNIISQKGIPEGYFLRVGVKGGRGCAGVDFLIGFDQQNDKDDTFNFEGVKVLMEKGHALFLSGYRVHYESSDEEVGFIFQNLRDSAPK